MQTGLMPPTEYVDSFRHDLGQVLSEEQMSDAYNRYVEATLQRAGYVLAGLFALFAVLHWFLLQELSLILTPIAAATSILIFGLTWLMRTYQINIRWVNGIAALMMELVLFNGLAHLYLTEQPQQTDNIMLAVVGAGFFFLSTRWYLAQLIIAHIGWLTVHYFSSNDSDLWMHYQIGLYSATFLSFMVHLALRNLVRRVAALRVRDDIQKRALQSALDSVQQSEMRQRRYSQQVEENLRQTQALYQMSQAIRAPAALDDVLQRSIESIVTALPAQMVNINLLDLPKRQLLKVVSSNPQQETETFADYNELMSGLAGWTLHKMKPALSQKGVFDPRETEQTQQRRTRLGYGSVIIAPILYRDEALGTLAVMNRNDQRDFNERDVDSVMTMCNQLAAAITNVRLLDELRRQATELQRLIEGAAAPILVIDCAGAITQWSVALQRLTGYAREEAAGLNFIAEFVAPEAQSSVRQILDRALRGQDTDEFECTILDRSRASHVLLLSCTMTRDAYGEITGAFALGQDITRRRQAEEAMQRNNEALEQRVAVRTQELVVTNQKLQTELKERERIEAELRSSEERLARRVEERTEALSTANAELSRAARLKDEFLANMSHELRTPLSAVLGLSEALQEEVYGALNEKQHKTVNSVVESSRLLLTLINDILDISKIEAGKFQLEYDWAAVASITRASIELVRPNAKKKNIEIELELDPSVVTIYVDQRRIKQILANLLSNAVKFTPENGKVGIEVIGDSPRQLVKFTVWDTGIGIAAEDMTRLFQPFVQLDSSLVKQHPGTGLGLALVYRMTRMHGGSVSVESKPTEGSRFTVALPWDANSPHDEVFAKGAESVLGKNGWDAPSPLIGSQRNGAPADSLSTTAHSNGSSKSALLLVADDNEATLDAFTDYLTSHGYRVLSVRSGAEAVSTALEMRPTSILMDINMPRMNGLEAIRQIRANPSTAETPIIAITAMAMPGDRERCLAAGANDYLSKPVSLHMILATLERQLQTLIPVPVSAN